MSSPIEDLSDWVAVKANIFTKEEETDHTKFICAWNEEASKVAVTLHEGSRKASDQNNKNRVCLLSMSEIYHMHKQFCLIDTSLAHDFPKEIKPNYTPSRKKYDYISTCIEHYLSSAVQKVGKKLVVASMFNDEDPLSCYEENWNEFKIKSLDDLVEKAYKELAEVLQLRERAESLLQLTTIYVLEDQVFKNISDYLSELYNFHLQPFLELREMAHSRIKQAKDKLGEEIGPNIRQQAQKDFEDWNEQSLIATEAIQQLYLEFYRKTYSLILGGRDRMLEDKKRFGKAAFGLHGMPPIKEYQRDKIKSQLTFLSYDYGAVQEVERIEEEIAGAQLNVFDADLDVIEAEERLYKSQLALLNQEHKDILETGLFFDAAETPEDMPEELNDVPEQNPKIAKLKQKLCKIYQKRAAIRNKRKNLKADIQRKKTKKAAEMEKNEKAAAYTRKRKETKTKELPADKLAEERRKTLQRLKEYKKKALLVESKSPDIDEESVMTGSTSSLGSNPEIHTVTTSKRKGSKPINIKKTSVDGKTTTSKTTVAPPPLPPLPPGPESLPYVPPPPPPPSNLQTKFVVDSTASKPGVPPSQVEITQSSISEQLKLLKKPVIEVKKKAPGNPFSLNEILATRSKLKAVSADAEPRGKIDSPMDLSSILKETMKNIRNMTEYSDQESDSDSDFE
ncbi:Junction-mediating and -regulatory protein like [Argiope bruennichi]|uniref:Junction-mediating and -regulatory protein like n=1 Tax=Argiope bruennichi TaxID=94029 RepID=A0A8T0FYH1_ARGBR|nr:Junction-mediating and -regulatory protein like [Argiope bruennichi]